MDMRLIFAFVVPVVVVLAIDYYAFQAFKTSFQHLEYRKYIYSAFWAVTGLTLVFLFSYRTFVYHLFPKAAVSFMGAFIFITMLCKFIIAIILLGEDVVRLIRIIAANFSAAQPAVATTGITRSQFLNRAAIMAAAVPFGTFMYGILANAYNYQYRKVSIRFPNLPDAFHGFKIVQLSDIHAGSFTRTAPLEEAVAHINSSKPDAILFTGDLVNNIADEMDGYINIFGKLQAKHGVFSVTGNHDYGDYVQWESKEEKRANFARFIDVHKQMGWDLLMNEHRVLEKDGQKIAIVGIENWGKGRFAKYGKLDRAHKGAEDIPFKILMSHDPSHWDAQVRTGFPDIDLMLSGHTHGAQFGVENKWLKWSPSQWLYKQWAGLYQEGRQYIYVNRGFGFLGYPGRVGILPEVTEITLLKG